MIWAVAWRNIWRNKGRSNVIIAAIAIGIFAGVFIWAFYNGMIAQRIQSAIITESSHIQVHHRNYLADPDQKYFLPDSDSIYSVLKSLPYVKEVSRRLIVNAMISSAETGSGIRVVAIDPGEEAKVTNISENLKEGTYLEGRRTPIIIGEKLAEKLSVELRSKLVLTLQTMDGTLTRGSFRIAGIYRTSNTMFDEANVFIRRDDLTGLINIGHDESH